MSNFPAYLLFRVLLTLLMLGVILIPVFFAGFILRLLDKAAKFRQRPVKIYVVDFFSLLFLIQIPLAIVLQMPNRDNRAAVFIAGLFGLMMVLVWWTTIKTVSRAGIKQVSARIWISLLVIPMTYVGSFAIIAIAMTLFSTIKTFPTHLAVIEFVLVALMFFSLVVTKRELKRSEPGAEGSVEE